MVVGIIDVKGSNGGDFLYDFYWVFLFLFSGRIVEI